MAGIEGGQYNFFNKKLLSPELVKQIQEQQANNINQQNPKNAEGVQNIEPEKGVKGVQNVGKIQQTESINPFGQTIENSKAEAKKAEVARIAEDAMQELQIDEDSERDLFLNDIKKRIFS